MNTMSTKVVLKNLDAAKELYDNQNSVTVTFIVGHNNGKTTLTQDLVLTKSIDGWTPSMDVMIGVEPSKTITAAAWKFAECMERMAEAIKDNTFDEININNL